MISGYLHPDYALSLAEFGEPRLLPQSCGWILERPIASSPYRDAMGIYPLFTCQSWAKLGEDLDALSDDLVSVVIVTDPFGDYDTAHLQKCFPHFMTPYKDHFISDLNIQAGNPGSKHHRYYARRAFEKLKVEPVESPIEFLEEWVSLYGCLIERHQIRGIRAFSRKAFSYQLQVPGLVMFRALLGDRAVGAHLWYMQDCVAYSHLTALNTAGYELMASYALYGYALEYFRGQVDYLDLGAGADSTSRTKSGLTQFKKGWSTETKKTYLCGRIFDTARYDEIIVARNVVTQGYFPAYRQGEFT